MAEIFVVRGSHVQGAGKGTLSSKLIAKYDLAFLSAGDMLRQNIAEKQVSYVLTELSVHHRLTLTTISHDSRTEVGRIAEEIVAAGGK